MDDIIIVGSGPAGISASLYIKRAGLSVKLIGKDGGSLEKADKIQNYFGLEKAMSGSELIQIGLRQAKELGVEHITEEVLDISYADEGFEVAVNNGSYKALAVLLATGAARKAPRIEGLRQFEGMGVSYCAVCDGFFYRGKEVAVLGHSEYALHEVKELLPIASKVSVLTNGMAPDAEFPENVKVYTSKIKRLFGSETLEGAEFADGEMLNFSGLFIAVGSAAAGDLARKLGANVVDNKIEVNNDMETNIPGLYAAGDCTGGIMQVSTAVAEGAKAALNAIDYVRKKKKV
ncbi:MAG TPA: NAD(P)/FAD-dependent oxidoreductase [Clostridiales bacterium]|nr:NAD(P)/FAD-dependent oxidoreductase [Clostridiales bacterium]